MVIDIEQKGIEMWIFPDQGRNVVRIKGLRGFALLDNRFELTERKSPGLDA